MGQIEVQRSHEVSAEELRPRLEAFEQALAGLVKSSGDVRREEGLVTVLGRRKLRGLRVRLEVGEFDARLTVKLPLLLRPFRKKAREHVVEPVLAYLFDGAPAPWGPS